MGLRAPAQELSERNLIQLTGTRRIHQSVRSVDPAVRPVPRCSPGGAPCVPRGLSPTAPREEHPASPGPPPAVPREELSASPGPPPAAPREEHPASPGLSPASRTRNLRRVASDAVSDAEGV